ncbi:hypothetical protein [Bradyrhizobium zhanjiangense]|nr:hypothetical protein [Bradyrhizobium zhanjiangense]
MSYKFDTDTNKVKSAAQSAKIDPAGVVALPLFHYTTFFAAWNSAASKYDLKKIDEGNTNPAGSLATTFALEFQNATTLREFLQNPNSLYLVIDVQSDLQIQLSRQTKEIDELVVASMTKSPVSTKLPTLSTLRGLQAEHESLIGPNPSYVAEALSRQVASLTLSMDEHGQLVYLPTSSGTKQAVSPVLSKVIDRVASTTRIDLCSDSERLMLLDIGKSGCEHLDELLDKH